MGTLQSRIESAGLTDKYRKEVEQAVGFGVDQATAEYNAAVKLLGIYEAAPPQKPAGKRPKNVDPFDWLASQVPADRTASQLEVVRWVFNHLKADPEKIEPSTVPNTGAIALLECIQSGEMKVSEFVKSVWAKTMPTKIDESKQSQDDGSSRLFDMMQAVDDELARQHPEWFTDEPQDVAAPAERPAG